MSYCNLLATACHPPTGLRAAGSDRSGERYPDKDCYPSKTSKTVNSRIRNDLAISLLTTGKLKIKVRLLKTSQLEDTKKGREPLCRRFC